MYTHPSVFASESDQLNAGFANMSIQQLPEVSGAVDEEFFNDSHYPSGADSEPPMLIQPLELDNMNEIRQWQHEFTEPIELVDAFVQLVTKQKASALKARTDLWKYDNAFLDYIYDFRSRMINYNIMVDPNDLQQPKEEAILELLDQWEKRMNINLYRPNWHGKNLDHVSDIFYNLHNRLTAISGIQQSHWNLANEIGHLVSQLTEKAIYYRQKPSSYIDKFLKDYPEYLDEQGMKVKYSARTLKKYEEFYQFNKEYPKFSTVRGLSYTALSLRINDIKTVFRYYPEIEGRWI